MPRCSKCKNYMCGCTCPPPGCGGGGVCGRIISGEVCGGLIETDPKEVAMESGVLPGGTIVLSGREAVAFARLAALKGAVSLEVKGLRHSSGRSMAAVAKRAYDLPGWLKKAQVLTCLEQMVEDAIAARQAGG